MRRFEFDISTPLSHPAIAGHFPGNPIVPGVLLLDQMLATLQQLSGLEVVRLAHVKFSSALRPDEVAQVVCEIDGDNAKFQIALQRQDACRVVASGKISMRQQSYETLD
ncbi:MAG: hypothetical protein WBK51_13675 [Polaromonas sp.]